MSLCNTIRNGALIAAMAGSFYGCSNEKFEPVAKTAPLEERVEKQEQAPENLPQIVKTIPQVPKTGIAGQPLQKPDPVFCLRNYKDLYKREGKWDVLDFEPITLKDFYCGSLDDKTYTLENFANKDYVLIEFTTYNCPNSRALEPYLKDFHNKNEGKVGVIAMVVSGDIREFKEFTEKYPADYVQVMDFDGLYQFESGFDYVPKLMLAKKMDGVFKVLSVCDGNGNTPINWLLDVEKAIHKPN